MGVPGLWEILRPASHCRSLTHLSVVDGFEVNNNGLRGYRVGIDASIWFFHSEWSREGENPQLRNLLFRLIKLLNSPFLPLFVFDGPGRPSEKRGKKINRSKPHGLVDGLKRLIVAFGFEWRTVSLLLHFLIALTGYIQAPGEAEAELAYLNRAGVIDAIISDDVDNFLFGASVVIRKFVFFSECRYVQSSIPSTVRAQHLQGTSITPIPMPMASKTTYTPLFIAPPILPHTPPSNSRKGALSSSVSSAEATTRLQVSKAAVSTRPTLSPDAD
jgi:hypothetical protein